jgi:hypothetical protein
MQHIGTQVKIRAAKNRETERGEFMRYFCSRINIERIRDGYPKISMGHMGKLLQGVPTKDLYYLKRVCSEAPNFSKRFWWEIDPEKHEKKE